MSALRAAGRPRGQRLRAALLDAGRTADAEPWLRRAVTLDPQFAGAYNNLGIVFARTGRLEGAIEPLDKARAVSPEPDPEIEDNLARLRAAPRSVLNLGRPFVNVPFDDLVIGGGLSLITTAVLRWGAPEDAYIWRLRRPDTRAIVSGDTAPVPAA